MVKQCAFFWDNEPAEGGGNFTLQPGASPSTAILRLPLRARYNQIGTLVMTDGTQTVRIPKCRVSRAAINQSGGGERWREITILDRRWLWAQGYSAIYGRYNATLSRYPSEFNEIPYNSRQLAALCLQAMGETQFDVSALSANVYPVVDWDAANPASELEKICKDQNCYITFRLDNRVVIAREGFGRKPRPDQRQMDYEASTEPPVIPRNIVFEGGMLIIQHDLPLTAVGQEIKGEDEGRYKAIDSLSYKPSNGWERSDPNFNNVAAQHGAAAQQQAQRDIWKLYALASNFQLPIANTAVQFRSEAGRLDSRERRQANDYFKIKRNEQWRILPLFDGCAPQSYGRNNMSAPNSDQYPQQIVGWFYGQNFKNRNTGNFASYSDLRANTLAFRNDLIVPPFPGVPGGNDAEIYRGSFDVDREGGLVRFNNQIYFLEQRNQGAAADRKKPAVIRLRTAFPLRDRGTGQTISPQLWQATGSPVATNVARLIKSAGTFYAYDLLAASSGGAVNTHDNEYAFLEEAYALINAELSVISSQDGYSAPYKGFVFDIPVDGITKAVQFDVDESGAGTTMIDYNMEQPDNYLTLQEVRDRRIRFYERIKAVEDKQKKARGLAGKR